MKKVLNEKTDSKKEEFEDDNSYEKESGNYYAYLLGALALISGYFIM